MNDQPVTLSGLILTLSAAALALAAYYFEFTAQETTLWSGFLSALILAVFFWVNSRTMPKSKPTDVDGTPLVRADTHTMTQDAAARGHQIVTANITEVEGAEAPEGARPRGIANLPGKVIARWDN